MIRARWHASCELMPRKFEVLATYNAEVWRGLVHTPEYDARMADLQREFDAWVLDAK